MIDEMRGALRAAKIAIIKSGDDNAIMAALPAIDAALANPTDAEIETLVRTILVEQVMQENYEYHNKFKAEEVHRTMIFGKDALAALRRAFKMGQQCPVDRP